MERMFERMLEELQAYGYIIVSMLFIDEFLAFCEGRGVRPNGGRILYAENAQFLYI